MRVLLAAKYVPTGPRPIGGVQSWVATVRAELERLGHDVVEWQPGLKAIGGFDLGIFANMALTGHLVKRCERSVCVSHGIIEAERPLAGAGRYLFVSEGVQAHWGWRGDILRQPIDTEFWKPAKVERAGAVRFSYRNSETLCREAARVLGFDYQHIKSATHEQARGILQDAALVFASGRAALEAMACGAPVVIYDHRSAYQGPLMGLGLPSQMRNSYSGRGGVVPNLQLLVRTAEIAMGLDDWRDWVVQHHDARAIVQELIA